ncbi:MAG: DUF6531 domain-containing protein, partial [Acidobacteriota bacterium]
MSPIAIHRQRKNMKWFRLIPWIFVVGICAGTNQNFPLDEVADKESDPKCDWDRPDCGLPKPKPDPEPWPIPYYGDTTNFRPDGNGFENIQGSDPGTVYLFSGELHLNPVDLRIPGRGMDFVFQRTYRSLIKFNGVLGFNWNHSYNERLEYYINPSNNRISIKWFNSDNRLDEFFYNQSINEYESPGFFNKIRSLGPGYEIRNGSGTIKRFLDYDQSVTPAKWYLSEIEDRAGHKITLSYINSANPEHNNRL